MGGGRRGVGKGVGGVGRVVTGGGGKRRGVVGEGGDGRGNRIRERTRSVRVDADPTNVRDKENKRKFLDGKPRFLSSK